MSVNLDAILALAGTVLGNTDITIKGKKIPVGQIINLYEGNKDLFNAIFHSQPKVTVPASARPEVAGLPDDKIVVPVFIPPPTKPTVHDLSSYTGLRINVAKAQYNREMFPDMYDLSKGGNQFGLYQPARVPVYNRNSKIWFNTTPLKGSHEVEKTEGQADGILWGIEWHLFYNDHETLVKVDPSILQDTPNGPGRPAQAVLGDSVGVGVSAWDYAESFLCQIQVGENQGKYRVFAVHPQIGQTSETIEFEVS